MFIFFAVVIPLIAIGIFAFIIINNMKNGAKMFNDVKNIIKEQTKLKDQALKQTKCDYCGGLIKKGDDVCPFCGSNNTKE